MTTELVVKINNDMVIEPLLPELFTKVMTSYKDRLVRLTVKPYKQKRTNPQNNYYWGVVIYLVCTVMNELGNEYQSEDVHQFFAQKFLTVEHAIINHSTGELIEDVTRVKSTSELDKKEFQEYIDKIARWSSEHLCLEIPPPTIEGTKEQLYKFIKNALVFVG